MSKQLDCPRPRPGPCPRPCLSAVSVPGLTQARANTVLAAQQGRTHSSTSRLNPSRFWPLKLPNASHEKCSGYGEKWRSVRPRRWGWMAGSGAPRPGSCSCPPPISGVTCGSSNHMERCHMWVK
jgi:hypothetical protein